MKTKRSILFEKLLAVLAVVALAVGLSSAFAAEELSDIQVEQLKQAATSSKELAKQFYQLTPDQKQAAIKVLADAKVDPDILRTALRKAWNGSSEKAIADALIALMNTPKMPKEILTAVVRGGYGAVSLIRADDLAGRIVAQLVAGGAEDEQITDITRKLLRVADRTPGLDSAIVLEQIKQAAENAARRAGRNPEEVAEAVTNGALQHSRQTAGAGLQNRRGPQGGLVNDDDIANLTTPVIDEIDGVSN